MTFVIPNSGVPSGTFVQNKIDSFLTIIFRAHTEENELGGMFLNWTSVNYTDFLNSVQPQIEWMFANRIPFDISCVYDFVEWASTKTVSGTPLLQWFLNNGCTLSTRAHTGSSKNAADAAWRLAQEGIAHNGILGTCDDINDYVDENGNPREFYGSYVPSAHYQYDIILGISPRDASGQISHQGIYTYPGGIYRVNGSGSAIVIECANEAYIDSVAEVGTRMMNGEFPSAVACVMANMGRTSDYASRIANPSLRPNAGAGDYMHTPLNQHNGSSAGSNVTGGKNYQTEIQRLQRFMGPVTPHYLFQSPRNFVNYWIAAGEPEIEFSVDE